MAKLEDVRVGSCRQLLNQQTLIKQGKGLSESSTKSEKSGNGTCHEKREKYSGVRRDHFSYNGHSEDKKQWIVFKSK